MKRRRFDRYTFDVIGYSNTFKFLTKEERCEMACKLASVWSDLAPKSEVETEIDKEIIAVRRTKENIGTYNRGMIHNGSTTNRAKILEEERRIRRNAEREKKKRYNA